MKKGQGKELLDRGLTAKERIMIHLKDYWKYEKEVECPHEMTQSGMSEATGLTLSHIPRNLKKLKEEQLVREGKAYVRGKNRRYKVYFPTSKGLKYARSVLDELGKVKMTWDGKETDIRSMIEKTRDKTALDVLLSLMGEDGKKKKQTRGPRFYGKMPNTDDFVNRTEELDELDKIFEEDDTKLIVIYGTLGYGASTLASRFLREIKGNWQILWIRVHKELSNTMKDLRERLAELGVEGMTGDALAVPEKLNNALAVPEKLNNALAVQEMLNNALAVQEMLVNVLAGKKVILAFDGYFEVDEASVEYFTSMVENLKGTEDLKIMVTTREDTPSYNRFYTILDIHNSTVQELHIRRMDIDSCRILLGVPDIEEDALRRLYLFSKGSPSIMKVLASNDIDKIEENTTFSREEIKLMLHIKTFREDNKDN